MNITPKKRKKICKEFNIGNDELNMLLYLYETMKKRESEGKVDCMIIIIEPSCYKRLEEILNSKKG